MTILGIDHINIVTDRLEETVAFYSQLLGLARDVVPVKVAGKPGAWMRDASGAAIIHLSVFDADRHSAEGVHLGGTGSGALHHVALRASDYDGLLARVKAMGLVHQLSDFSAMNLRQIFVEDPNHIRLEFNFYGA